MRKCDDPKAAHGGRECPGVASEEMSCNRTDWNCPSEKHYFIICLLLVFKRLQDIVNTTKHVLSLGHISPDKVGTRI